MFTVVENPYFIKKASKILTDEQRIELIDFISVNYNRGDTISGSGGVKKLRFAHQTGKGKSGASRVIYLVLDQKGCVHLIDIFEKNTKENLSDADKNAMKKLTEILKK
ncbi:MAG: addiction module toxin RelE [Alphaproteobacteria bacterium]|nr:MAG: addiction module toxin RelE [Alphaproteobacteria bacterium]